MRRLTGYISGSVALATLVTAHAFFERPNFYSATVYLSQSSACVIILSNLALVCFASFMYGIQQLLFGSLRTIEIEQLYERGWIAATEWLFALSIFRDEFGVSYIAIFVLLFVSKVWGWMVEGRLDTLEQQNPPQPRKFHTRLILAAILNILLPLKMGLYCFDEAVYGSRIGVMTMFAFEYAILLIGAVSTAFKYGLWTYEYMVIQRQMKERIAEIRQEAEANGDPVPPTDDLDVHDLDLPGWEAKGSYQFALDLTTDFLKLATYASFFTILTILYSVPIYIIRDLYMTVRSFYKRVIDYLQYQSATRDMHSQYPDATAADLAEDNTCIVCREDMKPWIGTLPTDEQAANRNTGVYALSERQRPKKLPCGHILHFSCLRSWLERQQACPICRRSVLRRAGQDSATNAAQANGQAALGQAAVPGAPGANAAQPDNRQQPGNNRRRNGWQFRLGRLRIVLGRFNGEEEVNRVIQDIRNRRLALRPAPGAAPQGLPQPPPVGTQFPGLPTNPLAAGSLPTLDIPPALEHMAPSVRAAVLHAHISAMQDMVQEEMRSMNLAQQRLGLIRWLSSELDRTRLEASLPSAMQINNLATQSDVTNAATVGSAQTGPPPTAQSPVEALPNDPTQSAPHILPNVNLPEGWSLVPLFGGQQPQNTTPISQTHTSSTPSHPEATSSSSVPPAARGPPPRPTPVQTNTPHMNVIQPTPTQPFAFNNTARFANELRQRHSPLSQSRSVSPSGQNETQSTSSDAGNAPRGGSPADGPPGSTTNTVASPLAAASRVDSQPTHEKSTAAESASTQTPSSNGHAVASDIPSWSFASSNSQNTTTGSSNTNQFGSPASWGFGNSPSHDSVASNGEARPEQSDSAELHTTEKHDSSQPPLQPTVEDAADEESGDRTAR